MEKEQLIEKVKVVLPEEEILLISPCGGQCFIEDCKDYDYFVVVNKESCPHRKIYLAEDKIDLFVFSISDIKGIMTGETPHFVGLCSYCFQLEQPVYGQFPIENYNWFDYKYNFINWYLNIGKNFWFSKFQKKFVMSPKTSYHAFVIAFALENNSFYFTKEQMTIIKQAHDCKLPYEGNVDFLKEKLESLKTQFEEERAKELEELAKVQESEEYLTEETATEDLEMTTYEYTA